MDALEPISGYKEAPASPLLPKLQYTGNIILGDGQVHGTESLRTDTVWSRMLLIVCGTQRGTVRGLMGEELRVGCAGLMLREDSALCAPHVPMPMKDWALGTPRELMPREGLSCQCSPCVNG